MKLESQVLAIECTCCLNSRGLPLILRKQNCRKLLPMPFLETMLFLSSVFDQSPLAQDGQGKIKIRTLRVYTFLDTCECQHFSRSFGC